jgi:hypothetical protein
MSGLWTPAQGIALLKMRPKQRTVTLRDGRRAKVTIDDSATVIQVEHDERLDAIVRPDVVRLKVQRFWGPHGHPKPEGPLKGKEGRYGPPRTDRG